MLRLTKCEKHKLNATMYPPARKGVGLGPAARYPPASRKVGGSNPVLKI